MVWHHFGTTKTMKTKEVLINHALIDKGIVPPSGTHTPPFVEKLWTVASGDTDTADHVDSLLAACIPTAGRPT